MPFTQNNVFHILLSLKIQYLIEYIMQSFFLIKNINLNLSLFINDK